MARHLSSIILTSVMFCSTAFGQGADTPTAASDEEDTKAVEVGVGTTAATTTGSSGPDVPPGGPSAATSRYSCYNVNQPKEYARCFRGVTGSDSGSGEQVR